MEFVNGGMAGIDDGDERINELTWRQQKVEARYGDD